MAVRKSKHGGARKGAGRPRGSTTALPRTQIAVSADLALELARWAKQHHLTLRAAADLAVTSLVLESTARRVSEADIGQLETAADEVERSKQLRKRLAEKYGL